MSQLNSTLPEWQALAGHAATMQRSSLRELFAADPERYATLHVDSAPWLFDMSRQRITSETLGLLQRLAAALKLDERIAAMLRGDLVNATEGRAALHVALRSPFAGGGVVQTEVAASRARVEAFVARVRSGQLRGATAPTSGRCWSARRCATSGAGG